MERDYYEVLGIRPSAGSDEIELAYRGRRSQYHPDRYANTDVETLDWATSKMKELNEAYAVLKDPDERARFDWERSRHQRSDQHRSHQAESRGPTPPPLPTLAQALEGMELNGEPLERIFIAPHIPRKKLAGALESYGEGLRAKDVVVLIDDTLFGGAREGVLITEAQIRCKAVFQRAETRLLGVLSEIAADGKHLYIGGERYIELNMPNKGDLKRLFETVTNYLQHHH
ncbi:J domain-containing protein [Stenotrophomonas tumulicola]|uniref:J domain-containing protein n=1 Tax=Stenotrophomonas tumulicola TaxID=1685415 RepID=UPI001FE36E30|nr:DnaJ domain-containing protein [Stenotrophomonas tumulicola]